jgi:hypothetical protein
VIHRDMRLYLRPCENIIYKTFIPYQSTSMPRTDARSVSLYTDNQIIPTLKELLVEGLVPLIIDKFVLYIYICPISIFLLDTPHPDTNPNTVAVIFGILVVVFIVNIAVYTSETCYYVTCQTRESPMFRSVYVCLCTALAARWVGVGIVCFTITTFLPVIYVNVSGLIPQVTAGYVMLFFILTAINTINSPAEDTTHKVTVIGWSETFMQWVLLIVGVLYHAIWSSTHRHTSDITQKPLFSYLFIRLRNSPLPIAMSRTIMTLLCVVLRDTYRGRRNMAQNSSWYAVDFIQTLSLLITMSTFLAWSHCQHSHRNSLSTVLSAAVVSAACGILIENAAQAICLCVIAGVAVWVDVSQSRKVNRNTKSD